MTTYYKIMLDKKIGLLYGKTFVYNSNWYYIIIWFFYFKVELVRPLSLIKMFQVNTKGSKRDQIRVYIASS